MSWLCSRRSFLAGVGSAAAAGLLSGCAQPALRADGLPEQLVWSTYGVGTGTYNDLAAVANTLTQESGIQMRLMTADTGIGRLAPLMSHTAHYARSGDEYYYAFEGDDEFASAQWGPQPIRQIFAPPGNYGVLVLESSGIESVEDLAGRRYPRLVASTSMNRKLEAILNYGGLTSDDVELVDISYAEQIAALRSGQLDALYQNVVGANIEELASQYPVRWLDLGGDDQSRYDTWESLAPMVRPGEFTSGAGLDEGESVVNMQYSIPLTTLAERSADEVLMLLEHIDENYDRFKDATPDARRFHREQVLMTPMVVPFHDGAVQFFERVGRWSEQLQARQDALLEREELMLSAWDDFWEEHGDSGEAAQRWYSWKQDNLPSLPDVDDDDTSETEESRA